MTSLRHAAYRASLLAPNALRSSRIAIQPFRYAFVARPSISLFSTRSRLFADELAQFERRESSSTGGFTDVGEPNNNLYIGNLFFDVTPGQLRQNFEKYGKLRKVRVVTSPEGYSKGYAFVEFEDVESAQNAQIAANLSVYAGRRIIVHFAKPGAGSEPRRRTKEPSTVLFIGNISFDMSDRELNELFRPLKGIKDVRVSVDRKTGKPRGFAHADFVDLESATAAFNELNGKIVRERNLRCDYSDAAPPSRLQRNEAANMHKEKYPQSTLQQDGDAQSSSSESKDEGSHQPPQDLDQQPEQNQEKEFEQPEEHATQKLEEEIEKVPEEQAEKKE